MEKKHVMKNLGFRKGQMKMWEREWICGFLEMVLSKMSIYSIW